MAQRQNGNTGGAGAVLWTALALALWGAAAVWFFHAHGWLLYYGDAEAHLNIARRIVDSQTPGYDQIGTVWLPLPHLATAFFARYDSLWRSGLAGAIPSSFCFVVAGVFLFAALRRIFGSQAAAVAGTAVFALNPNLLYLQSTSMTEAYFAASLCGSLYFTVRYRETQGWGALLGAALAALAGTLARYDAWFLLPFLAAFFFFASKRARLFKAAVFCALAGAGPLYWFAHNWYLTGDALAFWRGEYSAAAIQAGRPYPGKGDWYVSALYYLTAVRQVAGPVAAALGIAGALAALARRAFWPIALLSLPLAFYIWSLHSSGTPIYLPDLWPHTYYNSRYGVACWPLIAFALAALVSLAPPGAGRAAAGFAIAAGLSWWALHPSPASWVTWAESRANSESSRAWTTQTALYLRPRYHRGAGIFTSSGDDFSGIYRQAGIPLRETFGIGNGLMWRAALVRQDMFLQQEWAVVRRGDAAQKAIAAAPAKGVFYRLAFTSKDGEVEVYRRQRRFQHVLEPGLPK